MDKLEELFTLRERFMVTLRERKPDEYPNWPVNLGDKKDQQHVRDMALRGVEEMFEALQQYKSNNGDCNVPQSYNPQLGRWVNKQRQLKRKDNKTKSRKQIYKIKGIRKGKEI